MITKSLEEYLKTMYVLRQNMGEIRVTDIASKMKCTKPSVNKALNALKAEALINYEAYGKIEITEEGDKLAKKTLEAYDIVYLFLTEVLDLERETAEADAKNIKATSSDETLTKLAKYVHRVLGLSNLDCNYNINNEKCIDCIKISSRDKINKSEKGNES